MIRQSTIDKLHDLRLSAMSDAFECQCRDPETYQGLSFEDRFGMLVDKEWDKRKSTKLQKLIRSEYSCAVTPQVRQTGNRLSGLAGTAYASLLA